MGTRGMRASLMSREVIADSAELAVRGFREGLVLVQVADATFQPLGFPGWAPRLLVP